MHTNTSGVSIEEVLEKSTENAVEKKTEGNNLYKEGKYKQAIQCYSEAIELSPDDDLSNLGVYYSNRAASFLMLEQHEDCVRDCNRALELKPKYTKALLRRAKALEALDDKSLALRSYKEVLEEDPMNSDALAGCKRLRPAVEEAEAKQKEEVMGKLKDMGNSILGKFGMSLNNFKSVQDPNTGSYSISYQP